MKPYSNISLKNYLRGAWGNDATIGRYSRTDFKAAQRLFADHGYKDTSVRAVVARARVNQAAINYHFGGKDGLYREVLRATIRALTEHQLAHAEEMKGMSRENALAEFIKYQLRPLAARDELGRHFRIFNWEAVRPTAIYRKLMSEETTPFLSFAVDLMRRFMPTADQRTLTMAAIWLVGQCIVFVRNREQLANPPVSLDLDDATVERLTNSCQRVGARRLSGRGGRHQPRADACGSAARVLARIGDEDFWPSAQLPGARVGTQLYTDGLRRGVDDLVAWKC